jgi:hypothetical protein
MVVYWQPDTTGLLGRDCIEMDISNFIQLGLGGVALFFMYKLMNRFLDVIPKLSASIEKNTHATNELYTYVRTRNGTLERIALADPKTRKAVQAMVQETKTEN